MKQEKVFIIINDKIRKKEKLSFVVNNANVIIIT